MYQGKRKNKKWTIQEKNEIVFSILMGIWVGLKY